MRQHQRRGILRQRQFHDLAGVDTCSVNRSAEQFYVLNEPVALVKQKHAKHLMFERTQLNAQKVLHQLW